MSGVTAKSQPEASAIPANYSFYEKIPHLIIIAIRSCPEFYSEGN